MPYDLTYTGERYLPWSEDYQTGYEHVHRYLLACEYAKDMRVLDISCGEGYGTAMLASVARFVIGVDIDGPTVAHARQQHNRANIHFVQADAQQFALAPGSIDLAVSYETLEHFTAHEAFLSNLRSALTNEGVLIISTPNRHIYHDTEDKHNPFHERELYRDEFMALLRQHFIHVQLFGQHLVTGSVLGKARSEHFLQRDQTCRMLFTEFASDQTDYLLNNESTLEPRYYIAVCAQTAIRRRPDSVMLDNQETLYRQSVVQAEELVTLRSNHYQTEQKLGAAEWNLAHLQEDLDTHKIALNQARTELTETGTALEQSHAELANAHSTLEQTYMELANAHTTLEQSHVELAETRTALEQSHAGLAETRTAFEQLHVELANAYTTLEQSHAELAETRTALDQSHAELAEIVREHERAQRNADRHVEEAQRRLSRVLVGQFAAPGTPLLPVHAPSSRALVLIPGGLNYFYDQAGYRIAEGLRSIGFTVDVATIRDPLDFRYDLCVLVNLYEIAARVGDEVGTVRHIAYLKERCTHIVLALLEDAGVQWFTHNMRLCREANVQHVFDLGFHDQRAQLPADMDDLHYHFVFNGLTESERQIAIAPLSAVEDRPIPWVLVGHQTSLRASLAQRLAQEAGITGVVYLPHIAPVTSEGPHLNEQQIATLLRHARYQVWCSHHDRHYLESERFRASLLTGSVPIKALLSPPDETQSSLFPYLLFDIQTVASQLSRLDFASLRHRFSEEFAALPPLEEGLLEGLLAVFRR